jgi:hypothetical protein
MRSATLHAWATNSASSGSSSQRDVTECHKALPARPSAAGSSGFARLRSHHRISRKNEDPRRLAWTRRLKRGLGRFLLKNPISTLRRPAVVTEPGAAAASMCG